MYKVNYHIVLDQSNVTNTVMILPDILYYHILHQIVKFYSHRLLAGLNVLGSFE